MTDQLPTILESLTPVDVFSNNENINKILAQVESIVDSHTPDLETESGRKEIASLAYSVARSKTYLDDKGKDLVSEWKEKAKKVDKVRKDWRDKMDDLKSKARKPLDDWEANEEARKLSHTTLTDQLSEIINSAPVTDDTDALDSFHVLISDIEPRDFEEYAEVAERLIPNAKGAVDAQLAVLAKRKADEEELARLREEQEKREREEREENIRKEAAAKAEQEAEDAKRREAEAKQREQDAIAKAAADKLAAEEQAAAAKAKAEEDAKQAAIEAEKRATEQAELAAAAERKRIEDAKAAEVAEAAKREANKKHHAKINNEAKADFIAGGLSEEQATLAVTLLAQKKISHATISY